MPGFAPGIFVSSACLNCAFESKDRKNSGLLEDYQGGNDMARVALVTGGTRGIGAAISKALKAAGYKVAASYAGNDAAAEKFKAETGIPVYKWDVSSFDACVAGVKKVEADLGPVDVLVNKGGITVNVICPGYINTEMVQAVPKDVLDKNILPQIPVNRLGEPEEIARSVVFLAADDAGFITGSTLTVNGGQYHA